MASYAALFDIDLDPRGHYKQHPSSKDRPSDALDSAYWRTILSRSKRNPATLGAVADAVWSLNKVSTRYIIEDIALRARCSVSTAKRCLKDLRTYRFVSIAHRYRWLIKPRPWQRRLWVRDANVYFLRGFVGWLKHKARTVPKGPRKPWWLKHCIDTRVSAAQSGASFLAWLKSDLSERNRPPT